jgi:uncharacterized protein (DUF697 family)
MKEAKGEATVDPTAEETTAEEAASVNVTPGREARVEKLARNHILTAMGAGLVPVPLVDLVALTAVQLDMIRKLSAEYGVPFKQDRGKSIITSLVGGVLSVEIGLSLSILKCVPVVGQSIGALIMPVVSGAATYAIYKVFVQHFESGGTFLDLDPAKVKSYFAEQFTKGKKFAKNLKTETPSDTAA